MLLSTAMRRGAKMCPQAIGKWYDEENGGGCAMTAAMLGAGIISRVEIALAPYANSELHKTFQLTMYESCPVCRRPGSMGLLVTVIQHLNDTHKWSRERIAGWIEAQVETPTYSMLQMKEFMGDPIPEPVAKP